MNLTVPYDACGSFRRRQRDFEYRPASRAGAGLNLSSMLPQNCFADAQAQTGAASRPLGGIERIENVGQHLGGDSRPVILKDNRNRLVTLFQPDPQRTQFAGLAHRLFGVQDEIEENLHQLMRIAVDHGY